ncbi:MAG: proton-conducting transporter transmembrane domain-containing protein [Dermatophilaceae bacterium]
MTFVAIALGLFAAGLVVDLVARGRTPVWRVLPLAVALGACVLLAVAGARATFDGAGTASLRWLLGPVAGVGDTGLVLDRLAGMFLLVVSAVAVPALLVVAAWSWRQEAMRTLPAGLCLLLGSSVLVLLARDVFVLVLAWELVTGAFYWLTVPGRHRSDGDGDVNPALATVGFGKVSGAALLLGSLLLAANSGSTSLDHLGSGAHGPARAAGYTLLVVAFAVKVGLAPLQVWMPRGYAAGCGPARALMAGAAVNIGFYGLWRTLQVLGAPPGWLAVTVLLLGGLTALLGIAHATVQTRLTGVVAYSSVENAGLIAVAYAVAMLGAITGKPQLLAAGLLAATLQVIAHAVGKTLLFASAGFIESRLGTDDIEALRGVARRLPWSGTGLAVGALMMAGLPPTALFVSEWFILETLMQQFRLGQLTYALPMAGAGALVALTAGFAGVAFARLAAFTALGRTSERLPHVPDVGVAGKVGLVALMLACFGLAVLTPLEVQLIGSGLSDLVPQRITDAAVASPWVLGPVYRDFSALSPTWLAIELPLMLLLTFVLALLLSRGKLLRVRRVEVWRSATGGVDGADEYTAFGYANPTRKVLANLLMTRTELRTLERQTGGRVGDERAGAAGAHLGYTTDVVEVTETYLYRPIVKPLRALVVAVRRLQSGRLDAYLFYMLLALVAVITVAIR